MKINVARALTIEGWMSEHELRFLAEHAAESKIILEAGSYKGRSTRAMADNTKGIVYAIDPWNGNYGEYDNPNDLAYNSYKHDGYKVYDQFRYNLKDHIDSGRVIPSFTKFTDFYTTQPDMIFIDACHEYEQIKRDIYHALLMLPKSLCGHDYSDHWPGVIKAVDEIFGPSVGQNTINSIWWVKL